jgi:hypothetical protein
MVFRVDARRCRRATWYRCNIAVLDAVAQPVTFVVSTTLMAACFRSMSRLCAAAFARMPHKSS